MKALLEKLQIKAVNPGACAGPEAWIDDPAGPELVSFNPTTGQPLASIRQATPETYDRVLAAAGESFLD